MHEPSRFCGRSQGLINGNVPVTVCSTTTPFMIRFNSDNFEFTGPMTPAGQAVIAATREAAATSPDIGFRLGFFQDNNRCFDPV